MLCQNCSKRPTCKKPCERLNRDLSKHTRAQRELPIASEAALSVMYHDVGYSGNPHSYAEILSAFSEDNFSLPFLTPLQNKCIHLFYFEGKTYKEIAFRLSGNRKGSCSCGQVRDRLHSAKQLIRQHLFGI